MELYREGDLLEVTVKDFRVTQVTSYGLLRVVRDDIAPSRRTSAESDEIFINHNLVGRGVVTIRKSGSGTAFRPQPGDVYKCGEELFFCRKYEGESGKIFISNYDESETYTDAGYASYRENLEYFSRKNPELVMRNGERARGA